MFAAIGSSTLVEPQLPKLAEGVLELHSDMGNADDGDAVSRTPLKTLLSPGPMDVYLGSSPTPHSRKRSQQILSDDTEMMTPTAVRSVQVAEHNDELCSSPPQLSRMSQPSAVEALTSDEVMADSFENRQPDIPSAIYAGDTTDELNSSQPVHRSPVLAPDGLDDDLPSDISFSDLPSSTVDLQLTAQISAEMNAQKADSETIRPKTEPEENQLPISSFAAGHDDAGPTYDAKQQQNTPDSSHREEIQAHQSGNPLLDYGTAGSMDTSRVTDSFLQPSGANNSSPNVGSQLQKLRRGSRSSVVTPTRQSGRKRKQAPVESARKQKRVKEDEPKSNHQQSSAPSFTKQDEDDPSDCIIVAVSPSPYMRSSVGPKRTLKTPGSAKVLEENKSSPSAPSTGRRPGRPRKRPVEEQVKEEAKEEPLVARRTARRSVSNLSQVELAEEDTTMEDVPPPKRARTSGSEDVSSAKATPLEGSGASPVWQLSHVQVTPKKRKESRAPDEPGKDGKEGATAVETEQAPSQEANLRGSSQSSTESGLSQLRRILTPSSIISRIKNMIPAIKQMKLKKQEERELDDLMFEFRTEVHAAGRRGAEGEETGTGSQ